MQCLFDTDAKAEGSFSLHFESSQGVQGQVAGCRYNGVTKCFGDFNITHNGYNNVTITVLDTFGNTTGEFGCQKGNISMIKKCAYHPPETCYTISSTEPGIGHGTTTEGNSPAVPVAAVVVPIVVIVLIIVIIIGGLLLLRKYRSKTSTIRLYAISPESSMNSTLYNKCPLVSGIEECEKSFIGRENTGNHKNQAQIHPSPASFRELPAETNNPIQRVTQTDQVLTINKQTASVDQEDTSTDDDKIGSVCSGSGTSRSSFRSNTSSQIVDSDVPLVRNASVSEHVLNKVFVPFPGQACFCHVT
ncbi:hypothetical protein C0Q70_12373 [Pomacea canaliculata]|uniref:Uncharacterized protein n=2 Tax=Pomacea canaliculata TaxID=400727 RepID=A0A2T7P1C5_POMCA|nr:hypothetical protein C0Q70_12373 [Pomacea canaliculata]